VYYFPSKSPSLFQREGCGIKSSVEFYCNNFFEVLEASIVMWSSGKKRKLNSV
jgi:hypothetical protein